MNDLERPWRVLRGEHRTSVYTAPYGAEPSAAARRAHVAIPGFGPTPLVALPGLAAALGIASVRIKDESQRVGTGAFKALGASFALQRLRDRHGPGRVATTATDGNHGRAVAWASSAVDWRAVVYIPAATSAAREHAIAAHGAEVVRVDGNYDDAVAACVADAARHDRLVVQDMAWPGYEEVPRWIMQGYTTLAAELAEQTVGEPPTHLFLQCGVGSFAAAVVAHWIERYGADAPRFIMVEPAVAACAIAAVDAGEAPPPALGSYRHSFMACLSCGQMSTDAWSVLSRHGDAVLAIADDAAGLGMRLLAHPRAGDAVVVAGESGAATCGALHWLCGSAAAADAATAIGIDSSSRVLLVSTEGATDAEVYQRTVDLGPVTL